MLNDKFHLTSVELKLCKSPTQNIITGIVDAPVFLFRSQEHYQNTSENELIFKT